jgi:TPR repeat protein
MIRWVFTALLIWVFNTPAHAVFGEAERLYSMGEVEDAIKAYEKRASEGDGEALYTLGEIQARGVDVPMNLAAAYKWMCLASLKGVKFADRKVSVLTDPLTHAQIKEANKEAAEWLDENPQGVEFKSCYKPGHRPNYNEMN